MQDTHPFIPKDVQAYSLEHTGLEYALAVQAGDWPAPMSDHVGLVYDVVKEKHVETLLTIGSQHLNPMGFGSGIATFSVADMACWAAAMTILPKGQLVATGKLTGRFPEAVAPCVGVIRGTADVVNYNSSLVVVNCVVSNDANPAQTHARYEMKFPVIAFG